MSSKGWIKLWRKTQDSDMYKSLNSKQRDVMMNILMLANHEERTWEWQGELQTCNPGQFKTSLSSLQKVCADDVSIQNIRTAISKLEKWNFITNKSTKSGRVITVVHWEDYQVNGGDANKDGNKEVTNSQQRGNKEVTSNKNVKNNKELKKNTTKDQSSESPEEKYNDFAPTTGRGLDYDKIKELWNSRVPEAIQIRKFTSKRKRLLRKRYKEDEFSLKEIIQAIQEQPFLLGENDRGWTADFTWIIESEDHYTNILERRYKDNKSSQDERILQDVMNDYQGDETHEQIGAN